MAADAVGWNLKTVFKKRDSPAHQRDLPQRHVLVFEVSIPRKGHKYIGANQKNNSEHVCSLSHSKVRRRFKRSAANPADHGRAVATGKRIGDFTGAIGTVKRVARSLRGI